MAKLRRLVLDVLKPHEPNIIVLANKLSDLSGVDGANISIYEIDKHVENAKITIEGKNLQFEKIKSVIEKNGATIHSIDEVVSGRTLVKEIITPQDREHES
jgi:hypothetical protein